MSFGDLPRIRVRKWARASSSRSSLVSAQWEAQFLRSELGATAVKIVKEVRWRVFWKTGAKR